MAHFAKARKGSILYSPVVIGVLAIIVVFTAHAAWGVYFKNRDSSVAEAKAAAALQSLTERQKQLQTENMELETDHGVESEIRQKYSVAKPKEEVYVIVDGTATGTSSSQSGGKGWWDGFKSLFSH